MSFYKISSVTYPYNTLPINVVMYANEEGREPAIILHNHSSLEINLVVEGKMRFTLDGEDYFLERGDAILCNPFSLHSGTFLDSDRPGKFIGFTASLEKLFAFQGSPLFSAMKALNEQKYIFDVFYPAQSSRIGEILHELLAVYTVKSNANECRALFLTFELMSILFDGHYRESSNAPSNAKSTDFIKDVSAFVQNNFTRDIGTADAAEALHMEISQFCHTFKRHFGIPFRNHLCKYRCFRATELYRSADIPITDIATSVGFSDYCYFSRSFKKHIGVSPAVFFGRWKK